MKRNGPEFQSDAARFVASVAEGCGLEVDVEAVRQLDEHLMQPMPFDPTAVVRDVWPVLSGAIFGGPDVPAVG